MKKNIILGILLASLIVLGGIANNKHPEQEIIKNENVNLAIYLENEQTTSIPSKDSGYYFDREKSSCTNDAYMNWDSVSWSPVIKNAHNYPVRCELHFTTTYNDGILNGTDPILKDELIPVEIEDDGTVRKADLTKPWYSYAAQKWANAVITQNSYDVLTNSGDVYGATKNDGYVSFDGVDDYIDLGLENYDFKNSFTMSATFEILNKNSNGHIIIGNLDNVGLEDSGVSFDYTSDTLRVAYQLQNEMKYYHITLKDSYEVNKKYTLTTTFNGKSIKLYLNGELEGTIDFETEKLMKISRQSFFIGMRSDGESNYHFGNIKFYNGTIYNRVLSEEEIKESASSEIKVVDDTGLLRYIDFTNKSYETNEIIPESVIESYFVWIPKYRYQLWDLGLYDSLTSIDTNKVHEIPIIFGDYNTSDNIEGECTTPMESGASGNCNIGDYMTHPAFLSIPSKGFWVGKFETGYEGATSMKEAEVNERDASKIIVKPNVYSWRNIQLANAFYSSYDYKRNLDSHMIKNTEWGAVAYLQHSKYGAKTELKTNTSSNFLTGYQSTLNLTCGFTGTNEECNRYCNDESCNIAYPNSVLASTTNNISGIFDMSGGAWDMVMLFAFQEDIPIVAQSASTTSNFSGVDINGNVIEGLEIPSSQYYDTYGDDTVSKNYTFYNRILGDAIGEMGMFELDDYTSRTVGSWYYDEGIWLNEKWPLLMRGGAFHCGNTAGMFSFCSIGGSNAFHVSYRIVLTPS